MQPQTLDQDAVNLAKAIRQNESGGNFQARGKSGEYGAYQFTQPTWNSYAQKHGINVPLEQASPEQQNEVAYKQIKEWKDKGFNVGQIASMWNAGEGRPNAFQEGHTGTNDKGVHYDTPNYANKVATIYHDLKGGQPSQNMVQPVVPDQNNSGVNSAYAASAVSNEAPPKKSGGLLNTVGKGINFLFPIAGDVKNIVQGKNEKSGKQLLADTALSALPFIPGLGEVGLAAKLGEGAALGYGATGLQKVGEGKSFKESFAPNTSNIVGGILGAGTAGLIHGGGVLSDKAAGIPENIKPVLSSVGDPKLYDEYIKAAKSRAVDVRNPSPLEVAADYTRKAVSKMESKLNKNIGPKVGEVKRLEGVKPLQDVTPVIKDFAQNLEDRFGLKITTNKTGNKIYLDQAEGRMKSVLSSADQERVKKALKDLLQLRKRGNVLKASDVMDNLDHLVDYSKKDLLGNSNDPLEGFFKSTRHNINEVVGKTSSKLAKIKTRFHDLSDALGEIRGAGGDDLQRADLLLKRVLAGDKSKKSREVFDLIRKETGIDLTQHAVLADHAIRTIADPSQTSLLNKMMENVVQKGEPTALGLGRDSGVGLLRKFGANPETIGRNLVKGKGPGKIQGLLKRTLLRDTARAGSALVAP